MEGSTHPAEDNTNKGDSLMWFQFVWYIVRRTSLITNPTYRKPSRLLLERFYLAQHTYSAGSKKMTGGCRKDGYSEDA
jgi:hypothetical protein